MRNLSARFSLTKDDFDTYEEMGQALSNEIQAEIDWDIIATLLVDMGWCRVQLTGSVPAQQTLSEWIEKNISGEHKSRGYDWLFKEEKDASQFALRWL